MLALVCEHPPHGSHLLDSTSDQLTKVTGHNPEGQVFAARVGRREGHDRSTLCHIPGTGSDTSEETTKNQIPLIAKFAVAVVR